mmetsp:Transcript_25787/g.24671  ORF Transcript_25787/g.24671 Transcript_25787/m.24671 type:complete len:81 (+) Transcript_25787:277-519(+)
MVAAVENQVEEILEAKATEGANNTRDDDNIRSYIMSLIAPPSQHSNAQASAVEAPMPPSAARSQARVTLQIILKRANNKG